MDSGKSLFDRLGGSKGSGGAGGGSPIDEPMAKLKNLDGKISAAIDRIRQIREEKDSLEKRVSDLGDELTKKSDEINRMNDEKNEIKRDVEGLLKELDSIELSRE